MTENLRSYHHIFENISQNYYFDKIFVSIEYSENINGTMEGTITLPADLIVKNKNPQGLSLFPTFSEGTELTQLEPIIIKDRMEDTDPTKRKPVVKEAIDPFFEAPTSVFEWVGVAYQDEIVRSTNRGRPTWTPNYSKTKDLTPDSPKLEFQKTYHIPSKQKLLTNSLFNYFKINDFVRLKSYFFSPSAMKTGKDQIKPWYVIRDFYITSIAIVGSLIEIKLKTHESQLDKIPCSISTKQKKSIWDFMMSYVFPTILDRTQIKMIVVSKRDYDTMKKSNIGLYRQNINTFGTFLSKIMQDYNLQFLWSGLPYYCICSYGNTFLPPLPFWISGGKPTGSTQLYSNIDAWRAMVDYDIARVYDDSNPVIVRITSVAAQIGSIKNQNTPKPIQKLYGDPEALAQQKGTIYNITTNIALDENALLERAKKQYTKLKYLGKNCSFIMKEPGSIKIILRFMDDKVYNNGFFFINNCTHRFTIEGGYEFSFETSVRFGDDQPGLDNLVKIIDL